MSGSEARDAMAAEYVLGCLEGEEARAAARRLRDDPDFAAEVVVWEQRLAPLGRIVPPAAPPAALWERVAASTSEIVVPAPAPRPAARPPRFGRVRLWQAATGLSLALAACLATFILLRPAPPDSIAVLAPASGGTPVLLAVQSASVTLIRPSGAVSVPSDHDMELWALAEGATRPRSLGVLPPAGRTIAAPLPRGTQLLVSLEPKGGSPSGQPTGPVIYAGRLAALD